MFGEDLVEILPQNTNAKNKNKLSYYYLHKVTKNSIMHSYCCIKNLYIFMLICHTLVICVTFECLEASQQNFFFNIFKGEPCSKCEEGWEHHGGKCYYFSTNKSSWTKSRDDCRAKGGDLVKIDSREEQEFLRKEVRRIMKDHEDKFWIGLTDSAEQGRWLWVDGSPLNESLSYWNYKEPDNWREDDCVMMGDKGDRYQKSWSDTSCKVSRRSICEKPAAK
uniref:Immune-related, lectin-like receptor 4 n=1 Tax=Maylandia zebra TaxID=106582 RepID=A0A3P9DKZ5_9CICH